MIKKSLRELPFLVVFAFYAAIMILEYGTKIGLHLATLSLSFFILCTPMASVFYFFHLLPFAIREPISFLRLIFVWLLLLVVNIFSIYLKPSIYSATLLTRLTYAGLANKPINFILLVYSLGFLTLHWMITKYFKRKTYKLLLHLSAIIISLSIFCLMIQLNYNTMVFYLVDMSYGNY